MTELVAGRVYKTKNFPVFFYIEKVNQKTVKLIRTIVRDGVMEIKSITMDLNAFNTANLELTARKFGIYNEQE